MRALCRWSVTRLDGGLDGRAVWERWLVQSHCRRCAPCATAARRMARWEAWAPDLRPRVPDGFVSRVLAALPDAPPAAIFWPSDLFARTLPLVAAAVLLLVFVAWSRPHVGPALAVSVPRDPVLLEVTYTATSQPMLAAFSPTWADE